MGFCIARGDFVLGGFWLGGILSGGILALGDFGLGGFWPRGILSGGILSGGILTGGILSGGILSCHPLILQGLYQLVCPCCLLNLDVVVFDCIVYVSSQILFEAFVPRTSCCVDHHV